MQASLNENAVVVQSKPPYLAGYTYEGSEAYVAREAGRLLSIRLETNRSCNLRCRYCYAESGRRLENEMPFELLSRIVGEAAEMGAKSVVVIGGGEPTIYPHFQQLVAKIDALGMVPVVFTNCIAVTKRLAEFLYENNASVMGKMDSLQPEVQDYLAGEDGAYDKIHAGLTNLIEAGFTKFKGGRARRLGVSFVTNLLNLDEVELIWHWCRKMEVFPNMEVLTPTGRAKESLVDFGVTLDEIREYKLRLLDIDREFYGYNWLPYTPLTGSGCLQHLYSLYVTIEGNIRPCAPTKFDEHPWLRQNGYYPYNVRNMSLRDVYDSELFRYVRHVDKRLEGKCGDCEHLSECIGCRGYAYSTGVNAGMNPLEALRGECQQCFK